MKCADISTKEILQELLDWKSTISDYKWMTHRQNCENSLKCLNKYSEYPGIIQAKLRNLYNKNYIDGCPCGCREAWKITEKGINYLLKLKEFSYIEKMKSNYKIGDKVQVSTKVGIHNKMITNITSDPETGELIYEFKNSNYCLEESKILGFAKNEKSCKEEFLK